MVLLFLNIYCSRTSQQLFYRSKHTAMMDKILHVAAAVGEQEVLNEDTAQAAIEPLGNLKTARMVITDDSGRTVYDSAGADSEYCLFPEVVQALRGNDVIAIDYHDGMMVSRAATPILSRNTLTGCAYILEYDAEQGQLIRMLQNNILTITVLLIAVIVIFSAINARVFTGRLRRIMESMRIIREGNYDHKVKMGGNDELTALGNNDVMIESGSVALEKLNSGECKVIMILEESVLKARKDDGSKIECIYPEDGVILIPSTAMIVDEDKSANMNTEACEAVANWLLSEAGQKLILEGYMHSVFAGMKEVPYDSVDTDGLIAKDMGVDWERCYQDREEIRTEFQERVTVG